MAVNILVLIGLLILGIPGSKPCMNGFPERDKLVSYVLSRTGPATRLIPEMSFVCNGTIVGYTVAMRRLRGAQHPIIQAWRKNDSDYQSNVYHQAGAGIPITDTQCVHGLVEVRNGVFHCDLTGDAQLSVQPGDILGLVLPPSNNDSSVLLFAQVGKGPISYVFEQQVLSLSTVAVLSDGNTSTVVNEVPLINLVVESGSECTNGFPDYDMLISELFEDDGHSSTTVTVLIPDMNFTCSGTLVGFTFTGINRQVGEQDPMIQIWRQNSSQCGVYYKIAPAIAVGISHEAVCTDGLSRIAPRTHQCILSTTYQVLIQPGDILGLELPPSNNNDFDILFTRGSGPANYIFHQQLSSTTISNSDTVIQQIPQITLNLTSENGSEQVESIVTVRRPPSCEYSPTIASHPALTITGNPVANHSQAVGTIIGSVIGCTVVTASLVFLIVVAITYRRHILRKHLAHKGSIARISNDSLIDDHATGVVKTINEPPVASLPYVHDPIEPYDYEEVPKSTKLHNSTTEKGVKFDLKCHSGVLAQSRMDSEDHGYVISNIHYCDSKGSSHYQTKMESPENEIFWEPANSVNELYGQLCSNEYREIMREQVQIGEKLGSGQFGVVSKGVWESPKGAMDVAVKQLQPGASEEEKIKFLQEAAINGQFRHPNVVMLMGVVTVGELVMIVLELLSNGNLKNFLIKCRPQAQQKESALAEVNEQLLLKFCQHIASGMSYLASKSFVHRDLAARNILVSQDKICKISDFGMSRNLVDEKYVSRGGIVPLKWMSPEAINYNKYSTASDVWSFGCVMYEIWSLGHKPFADLSNAEVLSTIEKGHRLPPPPGTAKELYKIMIQCWQPESSHRPTFPQLVELLSRADFELFVWEEEDLRSSDPQVKVIGAPLETAKNLYPDLQRSYISNN